MNLRSIPPGKATSASPSPARTPGERRMSMPPGASNPTGRGDPVQVHVAVRGGEQRIVRVPVRPAVRDMTTTLASMPGYVRLGEDLVGVLLDDPGGRVFGLLLASLAEVNQGPPPSPGLSGS